MNATLSMPLVAWDALISRVRPFASPDRTPPLLHHVRLYEHGGRIYAEATDRYRLAVVAGPESRDDGPSVSPGFDVLIGLDSLADLARVTKVPRGLKGMQTITLTDEDERYVVTVSALPGLGDITVKIPVVEVGGTWPDFSKLIAPAVSAPASAGPVQFNPRFLAAYAAIPRGAEPVTIRTRGDKPALVQIGDDFLSLLVPHRFGDREENSPSLDLFSHYLPAPAAEAVSA